MPLVDLDDTEKTALTELLVETIARDRFPLSPRIKTLRAILAKLEPPKPEPTPFPPVKPPGRPSLVLEKRRR